MIGLSKTEKRDSHSIAKHIQELVSCKLSGQPIKQATAGWFNDIDDSLHAKLAVAGLIEARQSAAAKSALKLEGFIDDYLSGRTDIKHWTRSNCEQSKRNLVVYFGANRDIRTITPGEADEWRRWLERSKPSKPNEPQPPGLAESTARRHSGRAKQFFKAAIRRKLLVENPFADLVCRVRGSDDDRLYFVTRAETAKVLAACPNNQWQLVFALSRFAGLRTPSEHSELRVSELDLAGGQMKVRSPKTEHLPGGAYRMVPISDELRPHLEAAIAELPKDAEYVITLPAVVRCRGSECSSNLGTEMARIIKRAGVKKWPKLFQNCRASCEIEWAAKYGIVNACQWIGNTTAVAQEHYLWATQHRLIETGNGCTADEAHPKVHPQSAQQEMGKTDVDESLLADIVRKCLKNGTAKLLLELARTAGKSNLVPRVGLEPTTY